MFSKTDSQSFSTFIPIDLKCQCLVWRSIKNASVHYFNSITYFNYINYFSVTEFVEIFACSLSLCYFEMKEKASLLNYNSLK